MIIDLLARSSCARVDLYGFDFFNSQSLSCHTEKQMTHHDFDAEKKFVIDLCSKDSRFKLNGNEKQ